MKTSKQKKINIEIPKNIFLKILSRIQGIVQKVGNRPFTQNVLINASEDGNCYFSATDLQIGIKEKCSDIKIINNGTVSLNARMLFECVRSLPEGSIKMVEEEDFKIGIIGEKKSKFELVGMIADDFPILKVEEDMENFIDFDIEKLSFLLDSTSFSISRDEERKNLTGAYFDNDKENNLLIVVTTDGYRVSIAKENIENLKKLENEGFLVPHKGIVELQKLLHENREEKKIKISVDNNSLMLKFRNIDFIIRLLNSKFPDYKKIIPEDMDSYIKIKIDRDKLEESLKMVSVITRESHSPVFFNYEKNKLNIYSEDADIGTAFNTIELMEPVDNEFYFCANCNYILDILNVVKDNILLYYNVINNKKPILIKSIKNENVIYIVMPLSTEKE